MKEFDFIAQLQRQPFPQSAEIALGIGDDAALCTVPVGMQLVTSVDTLVSGVHFPSNTAAFDIGYKALAVNLSDLAAMGATPKWFTLALTCPAQQQQWLAEFTQGLLTLAQQHHVSLIGGDTTAGHLTITIQICGFVPTGQALLRSGARVGDEIYVTGTLGDAGLGLRCIQTDLAVSQAAREFAIDRLNRPTPRLSESALLRTVAHSAIDISDGLVADLGHILTASGVGAEIQLERLPLSPAVREYADALHLALSAGDDYELCFTVPAQKSAELAQQLPPSSYTKIGVITEPLGMRCFLNGKGVAMPKKTGYQHWESEQLTTITDFARIDYVLI